MADDLDRASDLQAALNESAARHREDVPHIVPTGECHACEAPADPPKLFCDAACAEEFEKFRQRGWV